MGLAIDGSFCQFTGLMLPMRDVWWTQEQFVKFISQV